MASSLAHAACRARFSLSRESRTFLVEASGGGLVAVDAATGEERYVLADAKVHTRCARHLVLTLAGQPNLIVEIESGRTIAQLPGERSVYDVSRDGQWLLGSGGYSPMRDLAARTEAAGNDVRVRRRHPELYGRSAAGADVREHLAPSGRHGHRHLARVRSADRSTPAHSLGRRLRVRLPQSAPHDRNLRARRRPRRTRSSSTAPASRSSESNSRRWA